MPDIIVGENCSANVGDFQSSIVECEHFVFGIKKNTKQSQWSNNKRNKSRSNENRRRSKKTM